MLELTDRQTALEDESLGLGARRYRRERAMPWREEGPKQKAEDELPPGKELLRRAVPDVAAAIEAALARSSAGEAGVGMRALRSLQGISPDVLAYLGVRTALSSLSQTVSLQTLCVTLGRAVRDHMMFADYKAAEPRLFRTVEKRFRTGHGGYRKRLMKYAFKGKDVKGPEWNDKELFNIGQAIIERVVSATNLFEITKEGTARRTVRRLRATAETLEWLDRQHARCEMLSPILLPMLCEPKAWSNPLNGGYLKIRRPLVKAPGGFIDDLFNVNMPAVYAAVNAVQSVPWRINRAVLNVMRASWDGSDQIGGLPPREDRPLPPKPWPEDATPDEAELFAWKRAASAAHAENQRMRAKRIEFSTKLWIAEKFADEPAIYFPHTMDFRGRMYPLPNTLNPQSDDAGRGLLMFAEGKPLGEFGGYWLAVHIANLFGVDKVSFDDRVAWVWANEGKIAATAANPMAHAEFWTSADSPWSALAACFEWAGFLVQGEDYVSHLPVHLDGSCSGLQHFSALLRDPEGARAVNLLPAEKPQDIYSLVAERVEAFLARDANPMAAAWRGKVSRKIVKRPAMTFAYSATRYGMADQLQETLAKFDEAERYLPADVDNGDACVYLSPIVYDAICDTVKAASSAMTWLRQLAKATSEHDAPIIWVSPMGFPIVQDYMVMSKRRMDVFFNGQRLQLMLREKTAKRDAKAQANGISPNFVHSLDAAHLQKTVLWAWERDVRALTVVHDSFGTHAADTDALFHTLREAFVDLYRADVVDYFEQSLRAQLGDVALPPPPTRGDLDLSAVLQSEYCFA